MNNKLFWLILNPGSPFLHCSLYLKRTVFNKMVQWSLILMYLFYHLKGQLIMQRRFVQWLYADLGIVYVDLRVGRCLMLKLMNNFIIVGHLNFAEEWLECLFFGQDLCCLALFRRFVLILCPLVGQFLLISGLGTKWALLMCLPFSQRYAITSACYVIRLMLFVSSQCRSKYWFRCSGFVLFGGACVIYLQDRRILIAILHTIWRVWG